MRRDPPAVELPRRRQKKGSVQTEQSRRTDLACKVVTEAGLRAKACDFARRVFVGREGDCDLIDRRCNRNTSRLGMMRPDVEIVRGRKGREISAKLRGKPGLSWVALQSGAPTMASVAAARSRPAIASTKASDVGTAALIPALETIRSSAT